MNSKTEKTIFMPDRRIIDLNSRDMFSYETFNTLQKITKIDEKNKIVYPILMNLDTISRNRSDYEAEAYMKSLESPYIVELVRRGTLMGELEHPPADCSRERFMIVDDLNVSHRILNYKRTSPTVIEGAVRFVEPKGYIPWDWILSGSNMAFSTRVLTPNYKEETDAQGNPYMKKFGNMKFVTWDCVKIPGFYKASIADPDNYDASKENWDGLKTVSWTKDRKRDEFTRLLKSQETLPMLEDIYGFSMNDVKNLSYSSEGLITIVLNETKSIKIPTNVYKVNQVLCSLK